jgi:hypothetical protein
MLSEVIGFLLHHYSLILGWMMFENERKSRRRKEKSADRKIMQNVLLNEKGKSFFGVTRGSRKFLL